MCRRAQASLAASSRSSTASPFSGYVADPSEGWWVDPAQPPAAGPVPANPAEAWWPGPVRPGPVRPGTRGEPRADAASPGSPAAAGSGRAFGGSSASGSGGGSGELRPLSVPSSAAGALEPEAGSGLGRQRSGSGFDMDAGAQCKALRGGCLVPAVQCLGVWQTRIPHLASASGHRIGMAFGAAGLRARAGDDLETAQLLCAVSSLQSQLREAAEGRRATAAAVAERQTVVDALQARSRRIRPLIWHRICEVHVNEVVHAYSRF